MARLSVYQAKAGDDAAARKSLVAAEKLAAADGYVQLRAGVVHALAGRAQQALDAIQRAMTGGIPARSIQSEEDFERLRPLPRFAAMVSTPSEVKR